MAKGATSRPNGSASRPRAAGPAKASSGLSRSALRLLTLLGEPGSSVMPDPAHAGAVLAHAGRGGVTLGRGSYPLAALRELAAEDLVQTLPGPRGRTAISDTGRAHLRRTGSAAGPDAFAAQHREIEQVDLHGPDGVERAVANARESPLAWLRRRRDRDGESLIDPASFEAGERFRRDLTIAGLLPSVTARWDGAVGGSGGGGRDPAGATDAVVAARQRVRAALAAVGPDHGDLLVDLCGFLKGLELIERERGWPARSAKVVVRMALRGLARHYGLECEAHGPESSRGLRAWAADAPAGP